MTSRLRKAVILLAAGAVALVVLGPVLGAWVVRARVLPKIGKRVGRDVRVADLWLRWGKIELRDLEVDGAGATAPVRIPRIRARFDVLPLFAGRIQVSDVLLDHPRVVLVRGEPGDDNVSTMLEKLRDKPAGEGGGAPKRSSIRIGRVRMIDGAFAVADAATGEAVLEHVDADFAWDGGGEAHISGASLEMFAGPRAQAAKVTLRFVLDHGHLSGVPEVEVPSASASPIRGLELTGIHGTVAADPGSANRANLDLRGSYFGADRELWCLSGWFDPEAKAGELKLRADRFKLGKLKGLVQTPEMMNAKDAELDGHFDVSYKDDVVKFGGAFHVAGLTIAHPMLAPVAVSHIGFDARTQGSIELAERKLHLVEAVVDYRNVHASLAAEVENLGHKPRFMATLKVRPMPCQLALAALPPEVVPNLEGFKLTGTFSTDLHLGIDLEQLETPVDLGGLVGIEGCKVVEAPPWVDAEKRLSFTFLQTVQSEPGKWITFLAGPENPDWVPYDQISPHLINSIMTTEDNGFFKHHGFISSEFRSALQQNLQRGYFRLGASSITMQMVKNVLLSREKTLSRKLQEMFLTWYVEHHLTKERILEIYFNVIEFGPGIYGIGRAVHHYFGKAPKDLEPLEAAWFSSILPNPKRRYVQYCHKDGTLDAKWDAYVKRIMRKNHERGRLTDAEYEKALATPFHFDRAEAMPERECVAMVKRITTPLVPPDQTKN